MKKKYQKGDLAKKRAEKKGVMASGDSFFRTKNTDLAVCLFTCGVRPYWATPIRRAVDKHGKEEVFYNLERTSQDGEIKCGEAVKWWSQGSEFIANNETHPFAIAMAALMNKKSMLEVIKNKKRTITYVIPNGPTIQVTEGSKRQLALKEKYGY